jgi:hypothetical protein
MTMISGSDVDEYIGLACVRILRNRSEGFGIRNALCTGESCDTELTTKADETKVKKVEPLLGQ